jgi:NIMA (never in mitosis gene a)-related kinase
MKERFASCNFSKDFEVLEELYRSSTGSVFTVKFKYDGRVYVIKERKIAELGKRKDILNEVKLLQQLRHTNIVACEGWFREMTDNGSSSSQNKLYIILEFCPNGDLFKFIESRKRLISIRALDSNKFTRGSGFFEEKEIWFIFHQICLGLKHLHENGIIHRDIKTLNILISSNYTTYKISDLGVSRQISENTLFLNTFYGTPFYLSPELIENKAYNEKTDIWSLGVILYELSALKAPFAGRTFVELTQKIASCEFEQIPSFYSHWMRQLISRILVREYQKRPSISQIVEFIEARIDKSYHGETLSPNASTPSLKNPQPSAQDDCEDIDDDSLDEDSIGDERKDLRKSMKPSPTVLSGTSRHDRGPPHSDNDTASDGSIDQEYSKKPSSDKRIVISENRNRIHQIERRDSPLRKEVGPEAHIKVSIPQDSSKVNREKIKNSIDQVPIDLLRAQAKLRREVLRYRKLLQMRDFMNDDVSSAQSPLKSLGEVQNRLKDVQFNIEVIEEAISNNKVDREFAER